MSFTPRTTIPDPLMNYYRLYTYGDGGYNRFDWITELPQGNCTGYAYGRFQEEVGMDLHNDFRITGGNGDAKYWITNTWPDQTVTSGSIDLQLGDILVYGGNSGHVEIVEAIAADRSTVTTSYSVYSSTYASGLRFGTRTISYPTWSSNMGVVQQNDGQSAYYANNPFIGYVHNKYVDPTPPTPGTGSIGILIPRLRKRHRRRIYAGRR